MEPNHGRTAALALIGLGIGAVALYAIRAKGEPSPPPPPPCTEGETRCEGYDLYVCQDGRWVLLEGNSEQCGFIPPEGYITLKSIRCVR
ncbi:MAG: hypothetical protein PHU95_02235 [Candidatus Thermoplasmatota archaeon]|nr:hypothetical protein [Candidatus Thermoplasmatota archaeon]MDD5778250.1 hypothetical protein [Candidatus Thermoplasmatota archaeon]